MKQKYFLRIALVFFITIYSKDIKSQILVENFDNDSQFVKSENFFTDSTGDYFGIYDPVGDTDDFDGDPTSFGGIPNYSNYSFNYLIGEDLDAAGGSSTRTLTWSNLNITGYTNLTFSVYLGVDTGYFDSSDEVTFAVDIDGGGYTDIVSFSGTGTNTNATNGSITLSKILQEVTANITGTGTSLNLRLTVSADSSNEEFAIDNIRLEGTASSSDPSITFDSSSSSETETDATFNTSIPVTLSNYNADVTVSVTVDGSSTAEAGDYTLNTSSLAFSSNGTQNISLDINDDADNNDETVILNIAVSSGTADLGTSQHIITITDDELPNLVINEILADPDTSTGDANGDGSVSGSEDEFVELYNASGADLDISGYTLEDGFSVRHTFPQGTILPSSAVIVVFGGGTPTNIPSLSQVASTTALGLNNSGDTVTIKDASSTTVVEETYGNDGGDNEALARDPDLTGSFAKHSTITGNSIDFSPGRQNADNIPFSKTWTGGTDNDWTLASNWDTNSTPSSVSDNVWISSGLSNYPTASGAVTVNSVTINSGASLIAQGTFTGTVTYNRNIPTTNWYLISSPVVGQDIDAFVASEGLASGTTGNNLGLSDYNNTTPGWEYYQNGASGTGSFTSGDGRAIKLASTGDIAFTGTINTSDVNISITDATGSGGNAFNLVGNPYPSFIAANNSADATNNILKVNDTDNDYLSESTLWFWNQGTNSYDQINHASSAKYIAPGQGFFVSATGSVNLSITEDMQSHQGTDSFQRITTRPEIALSLSNGTAIRNADIYYIEGTTTGWDNGYDSSIFGGVSNEFAIYTHAVANGNGRDLGIQSLPPNNYENMVVPVGINAEAGTSISIDAATNNFPSGINIYLEDKQDNSFTLLEADANFSFTPENNLSGIGRFYLHTTSGVLSADDFDINKNISIYTSSNDNLRIVGVQNGTATVRLYNILGKEMLKTSFEGSGVNDIKVNAIPVGIYIVKLTTENGTLNRKIIIQY